jgi:hypothetical protein
MKLLGFKLVGFKYIKKTLLLGADHGEHCQLLRHMNYGPKEYFPFHRDVRRNL